MVIANSVLNLCQTILTAGGRAFLVGGWVRDHLRGEDNVDYDLEVYGLAPVKLRALLEAAGTVNAVGESFTVYKLKLDEMLTIDVSMPRREWVDGSDGDTSVSGVHSDRSTDSGHQIGRAHV